MTDERVINPATTMDSPTLRVGDLDGMSLYYAEAFDFEPLAERDLDHRVHRVLGRGATPMLRLVHTPDLPVAGPHQAGLFHNAFLFDDAAQAPDEQVAPQQVAPQVVARPVAPHPARHPSAPALAVVLPDGAIESLTAPLLVGRSPSDPGLSASGGVPRLVAIAADDKDISRTHARIEAAGGAVVVTDLDSRNGTIVTQPGSGPRRLRAHEPALREMISARLKRGKVEVRGGVEGPGADGVREPSARMLQRLGTVQDTVRSWIPDAPALSVADAV